MAEFKLTDKEKKHAVEYFENFTKEELSILVYEYRCRLTLIEESLEKINNLTEF